MIQKFIEETLALDTLNNDEKISQLLEYDCNMYTNLGIDSTKEEVKLTKKNSRLIYKAIKEIDFEAGKNYLWQMD